MNIIHNLNFSVHKVLLEHSYVYSFTYILSMAAFIHLQCRVESLLCGYYGWQSLKCLLCNYLQKKFAKLCPQGMTPLFFILFFLLLFCPSPIDSVFLYAYFCYGAILYAVAFDTRIQFPWMSYDFLSHSTLRSVTFPREVFLDDCIENSSYEI